MANIVKYNTRLIQKHDTEANWELVPDFIPLAGELIIYDPDSICTYYRVKYGDGITNVVDLPFASGQTDWEQTDGNHIGYMQNRPFYDDRIEETFTATFDGDRSDDTVFQHGGSYYAWVSENTIEDVSLITSASAISMMDGVEETIDIPNSMWQDISAALGGVPAFGAVYDTVNGVYLVVSLQQDMESYPKGIYVLANDTAYVTSFTYTIQQGELKQIDSKFIPPLSRTHIRYSAYADGTDFTEEWSTGQNYIGYAEAVDAPTDKADYQWSLFASNIRDTLSITLAADAWTNKQQTITTAMIGDDSTVFASPKPSSNDTYAKAGIVLSGATSQSLTFTCDVVPAVDIDVEVYVSNPLVIAGVQADCEQNDSTQADYIKNRPVYEKVENLGDTITWDGTPNEDVMIIPGTENVAFYRISENVPTDEELATGQISVEGIGDFTIQELTIETALPGLLKVGMSSDSEDAPFLMVNLADNFHFEMDGIALDIEKRGLYSVYATEPDSDNVVFVSSLTIPNYNFTKLDIKKLDPKYLPDGGFGYTTKESVKDTLTWDGTPTGVSVTAGNASLNHVSDSAPSLEELIGGSISFLNGDNGIITSALTEDTVARNGIFTFIVAAPETGEAAGMPIVFITSEDHADLEGLPKKGIYFVRSIDGTQTGYVTSLTIPGYTFTKEVVHKIDEKYLPDHLPVVELTTPLTFKKRISLTQEEDAALTKVAGAGSPVILKGIFADFPFAAVASTVSDNTIAVSFDTNYIVLTSDDNGDWSAWAYFIDFDLINLTNEIAIQNQSDLANLTELHNDLEEDFIALRDSIPQATASDNGKFLQVVNGAYALVSLKELGEEGM